MPPNDAVSQRGFARGQLVLVTAGLFFSPANARAADVVATPAD